MPQTPTLPTLPVDPEGRMAAVLVAADQYPYDHDEHRDEDHAHDDHPGTGQADQVEPGYAGSARASCSRRALRWAALRFRRSPGGAGRSSRRCALNAEILGSFRSSIGASHRNACLAAIITPPVGRLGWLYCRASGQ
jgi:hypothetical protein